MIKRFYVFVDPQYVRENSNRLDEFVYTCERCDYNGTEIVAVKESDTHVRQLCPNCGLQLAGLLEATRPTRKYDGKGV